MRGAAFHDRLVLAGAALFLCAHLAWLPRHLEDIDSINFALGLRDYDVAAHQPHPPGYPVFTVLARMLAAVISPWADDPATRAALAMAVLASLAGALALIALYAVLRQLEPQVPARGGALAVPDAAPSSLPLLITALTAATPLFWVTASRPLSDMPGLAGALGCQWLILRAAGGETRARAAHVAAVACGLAVGLRSQVTWLVVPLLVWLLLRVWRRDGIRTAWGTAAAALGGVIAWAVPMVAIVGGPAAYRAALASQAGEDLEGVPMLALQPGVRRLAAALIDTFVWPWGWWPLAAVMLSVALLGVVALRGRTPMARWLAIGFLPYLVYHLLFQETETTRYALPLVPSTAALALLPLWRWGGRAARPVGVLLCVCALGVSIHAHRQYVTAGATVAEALGAMEAAARAAPARPTVVMHRRVWAETRRARAALHPAPSYDVLPSPRALEWQGAARTWQQEPDAAVWWLVDPRRGDRVSIDPRALQLRRHVGWPMPVAALLGGMRPHPFDWFVVGRAQWVLLDGWGLTPELAGLSAAAGQGPSTSGATARVRASSMGATLVLGGRHVAPAGAASIPLDVRVGDTWVQRVDVAPGAFAFTWTLPSMPGAGETWVPLEVRAAVPGAAPERLFLEQFDLQPAGMPVIALGAGWYEPERDPSTGRQWRWVGDTSEFRVAGTSGDVRLVARGTWPRHYDRDPVLEIFVGGQRVGVHTLGRPFRIEQVVKSARLRSADGRISWRVSPSFVAGERTGTADARRLALEISALDVHAIR